MDLSDFQTDKDLELNGVWVKMDDETTLLIARIGNKNYNEVFRKKTAPHRRAIQRDNLPMSTQEDILNQTMAETVLLGWKGLKQKGKTVQYSRKKAYELLSNLPDFRELVIEIANTFATFKEEEVEEDTKNSKAS